METIRSLSLQSYDNFEVLVLLDRVSQDTEMKIKKHLHLDSKFRVLNFEVEGLPANLNLGIRKCRGELVARIDSDDLMLPSRLETQVSYFLRYSSLDLLGCQAFFLDEKGQRVGRSFLPLHPSDIRFAIQWSNPLIHPGVMMRSRIFKMGFSYDASFKTAEDYDLFSRIVLSGLEARNTSEVLIGYRRSSFQMSGNLNRQHEFESRIYDNLIASAWVPGDRGSKVARQHVREFMQSKKILDIWKAFIASPARVSRFLALKFRVRISLGASVFLKGLPFGKW